MTTHRFSRRDFARLLATASAGAGLSALPFVTPGLLGHARAGGALPARARRLLVVNLTGAARFSALFHASPERRLNPWGVRAVEGSEIGYGNVLGDHIADPMAAPNGIAEEPLPDAAYTLSSAWSGARVPRFHEMAGELAILGTWNDGRGDHLTSQMEESTGERTPTAPGLLTRIQMALTARSGGEIEMPPFHLAPSVFLGQAPADSVGFAPITLANAAALPSESLVSADLERITARRFRPELDTIDARRIGRLIGPNRLLADAHAASRRSAVRFGRELAEPWLNTSNPTFRAAAQGEVDLGGGTRAPLTNQMLYELVTRALGPDPTDTARARALPDDVAMLDPAYPHAVHTALAIRLLQLGSPTVALEFSGYDLHSGERQMGPAIYRSTARLLASIHWVLSRLSDPADPTRSMLDGTLVAVTSEFGRDAASDTGWNDGEGSDHGADAASMWMPIALFGSQGLAKGTIVGGVENTGPGAYDASRSEERFSTQQMLATLMGALGLDGADEQFGFPEAGTPANRLWRA